MTVLKEAVNIDTTPEIYKENLKTSEGRKEIAKLFNDNWIPTEWEEDCNSIEEEKEGGNGVTPEKIALSRVVGMIVWSGSINDLKFMLTT